MKAIKLLTLMLTFVLFGVLSSNAAVTSVKKQVKSTSVSIDNSNPVIFKANPLKFFKEKNASDNNSGIMLLIKVILCFLLPPLAVFLEVGIGIQFWINLILTILGWLPGTVHALLVVLGII